MPPRFGGYSSPPDGGTPSGRGRTFFGGCRIWIAQQLSVSNGGQPLWSFTGRMVASQAWRAWKAADA
ncbi:hypothetical protein D9M68_686520 [compost metagenome]